jgi:hypothetical protein
MADCEKHTPGVKTLSILPASLPGMKSPAYQPMNIA